MERGVRTAPDATVAVCTFDMHGLTQTLGDEAVLEGEVGVTIAADALIG